jgi:hypothetical protein
VTKLQNDKLFILTWAFVPNTVVFLWISAVTLHAASLPGVAGPGPRSLRAEGVEVVPATPSGEVIPEVALLDLRDFGAVRGLSFVAVSAARPLGLPANDAELVDALEGELEQARTALSALEEVNASLRLHKVETQLLAHPHLPQASFLMAECLALQAQAARAASPEHAAELEAGRQALEGPRAAAFGEPSSVPTAASSISLDVQGLGATDELELDGLRLSAKVTRIALTPGLHHARVWRAGRPIFAAFSQISREQTSLMLDVPALVPCGAADLEQVPRALADVGAPLPKGIACEHWARVREDGAGIAVALCEHSQCGPFRHWQRQKAAPFAPIAIERRHFPAWAGFALAGGAALIASGVVLWQSGAFERGRPSATTWEYGGLNPQALRF